MRVATRKSYMVSGAALAAILPSFAFAQSQLPTAEPVASSSEQGVSVPAATPDVAPNIAADALPGDIVVTAQGRQQRLQDVPISASVVSGSLLERANLRNLEELTTRLPSVKLTPGPAADLINIRGVGSGLNGGFEQSVGTFVDGVYRGRSRSSRAALFDVERVEVLKGPQTTFFGNNAIAGALNIATRRAEVGGGLGYNANALYAPTDGEFALEAGMSAPLGETAGVRVAGKFFGMNGYVDNPYLDKDGPHQRDIVARASFAWEPVAILETDARIDYGHFRDDNAFPNRALNCPTMQPPYPEPRGVCARYVASGAAALGSEPEQTAFGSNNYLRFDYVEAALTNQLRLGEHRLTSITAYYDHTVKNLIEAVPLPLPGVGGVNSLFPIFFGETYNSFAQELRLQSPAGQRFEYTIGGYYSEGHLDLHQIGGFYYAPFGAFAPGYTTAASPISTDSYLQQDDRTLSVFGAATASLFTGLRLNGGLRYSSVRKTAFRSYTVGTASDQPQQNFVALPEAGQILLRTALGASNATFVTPSRTDNKLMPSASVQYDVFSGTMIYGSYTKGFKAGGYAVSPKGDVFDPETVDSYEIGTKSQFFDRRITLNMALFLSDYSNLQESTNLLLPSGVVQTQVANVAQARSKGIDAGMTGRVNDYLTLSADVGYLDARYRDYTTAPCTVLQALASPICVQNLSGSRRAYAPEWSGNVGANFTYPIGDFDIRVDPSVYFSSRYFQQASIDPLTLQTGYAKVDLRIAIAPRSKRWEFALIGKNITDKDTGSFRNVIPGAPGTTYVLPDRPLSIAIQFTVKSL